MLVALTGGTGFVGRHTISRLTANGHTVRTWYRRDPPEPISGVEWIPGQLDDPDATRSLIEGCDAVVHTAVARQGQSFMREPDDPINYFQTNVVGSLRLIAESEAAGVKRFVFISSGTVHQHVADDLPLDERHPLWPSSMYGASKASVETLVHAYGLSDRLNIATLRPVSIVGVDNPIEHSKWFGLVRAMKANEPVDISGGGKVVPVDDLARAIDCLLNTDQPIAGQTYNCSAGFYSTHTIATMIREITGSKSEWTGTEKTSARELHTDKIEQLGMRFSGNDEIHRIIESLVQQS
ncbi:NAD-dependent epimerase/dehydratase family protein [Aporhodopirellula aestuarii]|uniref:NAD(P)-dependent oxidoreductase n=1 Tax=Aporhodopirellula aestuarii TaxID=2950107 RepID=A0ABT0UCZ1_9BACT|nr:NAD(P)-dependent oxidoreductase [Aporhodopirellula aestuarii]MCM2374790.1 NAD(P)-dependent oxidoreductase [Aporhodopirellula aestuarii]